ncbi:hypothetical protein GM3709_1435 [Geminocystis sp. NIES-3709]|nr:hypothetical protein GM3709_1435 [Geminocystis sp. NIES-3709]
MNNLLLSKKIEEIQNLENSLQKEKELLQEIPHLEITYEDHLLPTEHHQETLNIIFEYLGVKCFPVTAKLTRISTDNLSDSIENYEEIYNAISQTKYAHFLEEN